jgi:hypothetical protein
LIGVPEKKSVDRSGNTHCIVASPDFIILQLRQRLRKNPMTPQGILVTIQYDIKEVIKKSRRKNHGKTEPLFLIW